MARFLLRRLIQSAIAILGTVTLVFFIQHLTGDPTFLLLPEGATREDIETLRHQLGFDRPLLVQYLDYLSQLARFDLGQSLVQRVPVADIIASRLPYTLLSRRRRAGRRGRHRAAGRHPDGGAARHARSSAS